ncbi:MAG TPA: MBL fold metallo-hydrolase [Acidiferrobacteraceae bacterium]|nr:MBL fold metallo-hydrolase [Acidiferrobacteraceae bacterium]
MIFRQMYDSTSSTYTYVLADASSKDAVIIDPVFEQLNRDLALIRELDLKLLYSIDTHCHADHVTGSWLLQQKTGCKLGSAAAIGAGNVDVALKHGDRIVFDDHHLEVRATPGHTDGCLSYVLNDQTMAFTGDALLIRGCGRCDFQQGDAATLFRSITEQIFSLPDSCMLYPAHDYSGRTASTVKEEKAFNPRIGGGASETDFVGYMDAMRLPHPKLIDIALPANMASGKPKEGSCPKEPDWAPVRINFAGVPEIDPEWVAAHANELHILDVREPEEMVIGETRIADSRIMPLGKLRDHLEEIPRDKPVVTFCRSGRRSSMAVSILQKAGIERVANISGGYLHWRDEGLPLAE